MPPENGNTGKSGMRSLLIRLRDAPNDSPRKTLIVAFLVALICSLLVAGSTVLLKPRIEANRTAERRIFLMALVRHLPGVETLIEQLDAQQVDAKVVDLATGNYVEGADPGKFDPRQAPDDSEKYTDIPADRDLARIKRRAKRTAVYLLRKDAKIRLVILPVHGRGFSGLLYGYLGLAGDGETVVGLSFYQHAETPGLGALIDSPEWRAQWRGKKIRDAEGKVRLGVGRGRVPQGSADAPYQVDGLTGATWTSRGVHDLLQFWLGPDGYGPFLEKLRREQG